jgi:opacity protein-like surface antigen
LEGFGRWTIGLYPGKGGDWSDLSVCRRGRSLSRRKDRGQRGADSRSGATWLHMLTRDCTRSFLFKAMLTWSVLVLTAWPAAAEARAWTVTPFLSTSAAISDPAPGNSIGFGVALACDWTPNLGFEGEFSHLLDVAGGPWFKWSISNFSANAVYHVDVPHVTPYATFGLGFERNSLDLKGQTIDPALRDDLLALGLTDATGFPGFRSSSTKVAFDLGGGVKSAIANRIAARIDLRRFQAVDTRAAAAGSPRPPRLAPNYWRLYGGMTFILKMTR